MGNYNDFDLDIKKVQGENDIGPASITTTIILSIKTCTEALSCDGGCSGSDTCGITCGGRCELQWTLQIKRYFSLPYVEKSTLHR